jgi:hypothetical protein
MALGIQIKRIPLIVALWEGARFHGRKRIFPVVTELDAFAQAIPAVALEQLRSQFNAVRDLGFMDFNDTASAIAIHAGPTYTADQAYAATISFFDEPHFGGTELVLPPTDHPDLEFYGFRERISSWRYNPPGTRKPGMYKASGAEIAAPPIGAVTPSKLIAPIPLVVQIFSGNSGYVTDPVTEYSSGCDNNQRCITLVEDSWSLAADFGPEFDKASRAVVVWKGPDYNDGVNDPDNWQARLYQDRLTYQQLKGNEPAHRDLSPRRHALPNPPHATAPGIHPSSQNGEDTRTRAVRFVIPARQPSCALPRKEALAASDRGLLRPGLVIERFGVG